MMSIMEFEVPFLIASASLFALGALHALGADHLAAITMLGGERPSPLRLLTTSLRFAFAHSALLVFCSGLFYVVRVLPSEGAIRMAETVGGVALMIVAALMLHRLFRHGRHPHHGGSPMPTWFLGSLMAASGTRSLLLAIPATLAAHSLAASLLLAAAFGAGVIAAMSLFGFAFGWVHENWISDRFHRRAAISNASISFCLGLYWAIGQWI